MCCYNTEIGHVLYFLSDKTDYDRAYSGGVTKSFHHAKDGQWLGGSLQVPHDLESKGAIVVCIHYLVHICILAH